jgi:pyruvate formate lyase activating enzyme
MNSEITGRIFDIQSYSVHDGPGIRTLVFLKGCSLMCRWCSNPEGMGFAPQLQFIETLCRESCVLCRDACPVKAITIVQNRVVIDFSKCRECINYHCIKKCPTKAISIIGQEITTSKLVDIIQKDLPFFGETGGLTLSGGEPFAQSEFAHSVLQKCKEIGIHTAVESALNVPWDDIRISLSMIDFFIFDLKIFDPEQHQRHCRETNGLIISNVIKLAENSKIPLLPRLPVIPGINDDFSNIRAIAVFLVKMGFKYLQLMPYFNLGSEKYHQLGMKYSLSDTNPPSLKKLEQIREICNSLGLICL